VCHSQSSIASFSSASVASSPTLPPQNDDNNTKSERSESGFDSINDGILNGIALNIPLPPTREAPQPPIQADYSPQQSPMPCRKFHKQPIPDINFIDLTPSPVLKGNHVGENYQQQLDANLAQHLIENQRNNDEEKNNHECEIKIDELNVKIESSNVRKGIMSDRIASEEFEDLEIGTFLPKDRK
jgi:hypothetical protein